MSFAEVVSKDDWRAAHSLWQKAESSERSPAAGGGTASQSVISQDEAVKQVSRAIRKARCGTQGSEAADGLLHVPWANRRRQDTLGQGDSLSSCSAIQDAMIRLDMC